MARDCTSVTSAKILPALLAVYLGLLWHSGITPSRAGALMPLQGQTEVTPDATPEIQQATPAQASPGAELTVTVTGKNFSPGVYVSCSDPGVHVVSTHRTSPTQLEAKLTVSPKAQAGKVTLYVSNPASTVAATDFAIASGATPQPTPATHVSANQTTTENQPTDANAPQVSKVDPPSAGRGGGATVTITGKNFLQGAKVAFANPGVEVLGTEFAKSSELKVYLKIAADAATGSASMYVVNPGDQEAESQFEVTTATPGNIPTVPTPAGGTSTPTTTTSGGTTSNATPDQTFSVYSLANAMAIFQTAGKVKGTLVISGKQLKYQESGNDVFAVPLSDVQEVKENIVFGVNSGTFHIILKSGKVYHFISTALRPPDTEKIINSLQSALR